MIKLTLTPAQNQWLEATWTEVTQAPDVVTPAVDAVLDDDGNEVTPAQPERTEPGAITRTDLKHTSYHPTQLAMLQADAELMGTSLDEHAEFLANWVADYMPEPVVPPVRTRADVLADLAAIDTKSIRALREGNTGRLDQLETQAVALRAELAAL